MLLIYLSCFLVLCRCSPVRMPSSAGNLERWRTTSITLNRTNQMWRFWDALITASVTSGTCASPWTSGRRWSHSFLICSCKYGHLTRLILCFIAFFFNLTLCVAGLQMLALGNQVGKLYVWDLEVEDPHKAKWVSSRGGWVTVLILTDSPGLNPPKYECNLTHTVKPDWCETGLNITRLRFHLCTQNNRNV